MSSPHNRLSQTKRRKVSSDESGSASNSGAEKVLNSSAKAAEEDEDEEDDDGEDEDGEGAALVEASPRKALPGPKDKKDRPKSSGGASWLTSTCSPCCSRSTTRGNR